MGAPSKNQVGAALLGVFLSVCWRSDLLRAWLMLGLLGLAILLVGIFTQDKSMIAFGAMLMCASFGCFWFTLAHLDPESLR